MTKIKLSLRLDTDKAKALKHLAVDQSTTVQALLETAVDALLRKDDSE